MAGCEAENLVGGGVVVVEGVDAVAPLRRPAVAFEDLLKVGCWIGVGGVDGGAIEQDR